MLINASPVSPETRIPHPPRGDVAIILSGGGARAAYQVGVLRGLTRHFPRARPLILTGESAGAVNAGHPAGPPGAPPGGGGGPPPPWGGGPRGGDLPGGPPRAPPQP